MYLAIHIRRVTMAETKSSRKGGENNGFNLFKKKGHVLGAPAKGKAVPLQE